MQSNTKERILSIALELFSKRGYKAVSIRDICKELGFTESSIYYHFANKQEIMDSLLEKILSMAELGTANFDQRFENVTQVSADEMGLVAVGELKCFLLEPTVYKMISMLNLERMSDIKAEEIYHKIVFELPLAQHSKVFGEMIKRKIIREGNPEDYSRRYYSIIFFAFQKNCITSNLNNEIIEIAAGEIRRDVALFYMNELVKIDFKYT